MKKVVLIMMIGLGVSAIFTGCGSQTPKEQVYDITYEALSEGDEKVTPEKAKCIAEKIVAKLSDEDINSFLKIKKLKDSGYEAEIQASPKLVGAIYSYTYHTQLAFVECQ